MSFVLLKQLVRPGCWGYQRQFSPYLDGELEQVAAVRLEKHVAACAACRRQYENLSFAASLVARLPMPEGEQATPASWATPAGAAEPLQQPGKPGFILAPAAAVLALVIVGGWYFLSEPRASWEVTRLSGQPMIEASPIDRIARLHTGEWIETDSSSRALMQVGTLGQIEVDPGSRVRLVRTGANEHRLELARGRLYASIVAPPRVFQIETPSAVAIDLGCAYTLDVDEAGSSLLRVTSGWVALARDGRESFVPAGALCRAEPDGRLGTPYFEDASEKLQQALASFDLARDTANAFATVLAEARVRDSLTLWHLLSRVESNERELLYDGLVALIPAGKGFSRASTVRLEPTALAQWKEAVEFASLGVDPREVPVATGTLKPVGPMLATRVSHTATLLPDGKVLLTGGNDRTNALSGAELYDPANAKFSETGGMTSPRAGHEATLLPSGKVLITGGLGARHEPLASAELYDPVMRRFTPTLGMRIARDSHRATLLRNGKVLITGGLSPSWPQQRLAEIYDPATGEFSPAGAMSLPRADHTATLLPNGQVLLCAGSTGRGNNDDVTETAELFDPATNRFTPTGKLSVPRHKHSAVALQDGTVLVIGGADSRLRGFYNSAELYSATTGRFAATGSMSVSRYKLREAAVLLTDGRVLVAGGGTRLEIYDPTKGIFRLLPDRVTSAMRYSTTTLLSDGTALVAGGYGGEGLPSAGAWLFEPGTRRSESIK